VRKRARWDSENRESWGRSHFDIGKSETPMGDKAVVL
jgi:hypothetical protein